MAKSTTFQGAAKPFGKSGHFVEPRRHTLQAKGIKTGHLSMQTEYEVPLRKSTQAGVPDWIAARPSYGWNVNKVMFGGEVPKVVCDRATSFGSVSYPSCFKNEAAVHAIIHHNDMSRPEHPILCGECAEKLKPEIERHGYTLETKPLTKKEKEIIFKVSGGKFEKFPF